ncbi:hypothetical protein UFOVP1324_23 [uncultured Caudovirales phage]|uniref:Uncharacterized protein n=1 Tax=uncultured Caudovirales phage TaxID=2100421 RepID=A0A6J5RXC4_9CAUD|nr:hypothetical protein UFOVP1324_23 [uncultured Caudovirales phage]
MNYKAAAQALRDLADALEEDDAPAPKAAPKKKPAPVEEDDEPAPKPKAKPKAKPADDDDDGGLDYENDVRPILVGLSKDHGREHAAEVLAKFTNPSTDEPCTKGQEVDPADYEKFVKALKRKVAALEADD